MLCFDAMLCCVMLCYAESNDHWSLRVCPIPNLNLIPVVRWRRCPALVMTLDWLLWAAHTISIGAVPALQHLYSREARLGRVGFCTRGGAGLHMRLSTSPLAFILLSLPIILLPADCLLCVASARRCVCGYVRASLLGTHRNRVAVS